MSSWWYADNGQQRGPVDESNLVQLFRAGKIGSQTLLWREGLAQWQSLGSLPELRSLMVPSPPPVPQTPPLPPQMPPAPAMRPQASQPAQPGARAAYANAHAQVYQAPHAALNADVAQPEMQGRLANYSERYLARSLDVWIALMFVMIPYVILSALGFSTLLMAHQMIVGIIMLALAFFVDTLIFGIFGNTTGKALLGVRVLLGDGRKLGFGDYLVRNFKVWLRGFGAGVWGLNIILPLLQANRFNKSMPASYDISTNTQVITVPVSAWRKAVFTFLYILLVIYTFIYFIIPMINSWNS